MSNLDRFMQPLWGEAEPVADNLCECGWNVVEFGEETCADCKEEAACVMCGEREPLESDNLCIVCREF